MEEKKITENNIPEEKLEKVTGGYHISIVDDSLEKVPEKKDKNLEDLFKNGN